MKPTLTLAAMLTAMLLTAACNTTAGAGEDLQSAGKAIEKTANDAKD
jgi:predicted small secreted protein